MERVKKLEGILIGRATTNAPIDNKVYQVLRQEFMADVRARDLLPEFVWMYRDLIAFWALIQKEAKTYAERRRIIGEAFTPLIDRLGRQNSAPVDQVSSDALQSFDADGVRAVWAKSMERHSSDPEGAITIART